MLKAVVSLGNSSAAESVGFNDVSTWQQVFLQDMKEKKPEGWNASNPTTLSHPVDKKSQIIAQFKADQALKALFRSTGPKQWKCSM